jgi:predicted aspartyl protease
VTMKISGRKLVVRVSLKGRKFRVSEDALIDTGAAFTVIPPELADFLELDVDRGARAPFHHLFNVKSCERLFLQNALQVV